MQSIQELFSNRVYTAPKKGRKSERGELLEYFTHKINEDRAKQTKYKQVKISYVAFKVGHLKKLEDLYFLKSLCDGEEKRGKVWSKIFFGSIKIK